MPANSQEALENLSMVARTVEANSRKRRSFKAFLTDSLGRRKKGAKKVPKGYFDILYLDDDLRIHRTGEDNVFTGLFQLDPNTAPADSLELLPGVGSVV